MLTHLNQSSVLPTRVVILGANGFIARALKEKLQVAHIPVIAISSQEIDLTQPSAGAALAARLRPTDAIVMAAALTPDKGRDTATLIKNLQMGEHVSDALAKKACAHFIYLSSDAVYDSSYPLVDESTSAAPGDLYGMMHRAREIALTEITHNQAIPLCILRPCAVYGSHDTHNSYGPNRFIRTALTTRKIQLFGAGEETRDHVSIDDITALIIQVLNHRSIGILNLASGKAITFAELALLICEQLTEDILIESVPRSGIIRHRHIDITLLQRVFPNYMPMPLSVGLAKEIAQITTSLSKA